MAPKKVAASAKAPKDVWVVLLCGLPGSGKSTLRGHLVQAGWAYVCQDELCTADACEKALIKALKGGRSCIVDRCNVTSSDRRLWLQNATRAVEKGVVKNVVLHFEAVWMATPVDVCKERARARQGHETSSPEHADRAIDDFCKGMRPPERSGQEPYDCVQAIAGDEHAALVLDRYADPARVNPDRKGPTVADALIVAARQRPPSAPNVDEHQNTAVADGRPTMPMAELFVVRHGERADRAQNRDDGWTDDPPLTKDGRATAKRAGAAMRSLPSMPWVAVYSSPFYRCLQTASEIAAELGLPVRVEPGLSELCIERIFDQQPQLRPPETSLQSALTRVEVDNSMAPVQTHPPEWPEQARHANSRVLSTARALAARHVGQAICLVCHCHSLVEITRNMPVSKPGTSPAGYCALTHIDPNGHLLRCLDVTYLKDAVGEDGETSPQATGSDQGHWENGWQWIADRRAAAPVAEEAKSAETVEMSGAIDTDFVHELLLLSLDDALEMHPLFKQLFLRASAEKQEMWRCSWASKDDQVREKLERAYERGIFGLRTAEK